MLDSDKEKRVAERAAALIRPFESFSAEPYRCPAGVLTIGYGHAIQPGEIFTRVNSTQAETLLKLDVAPVVAFVSRAVTVSLTVDQAAALVSLGFNIGVGALARSTLLRKLNAGDYAGAADAFRQWVYGGGKKLPGLVRRREAERELFLKA